MEIPTLDYVARLPAQEEGDSTPIVWGLHLTAWVKITLVAILLIATFRFNLVRLWLKTNPFTGEPNWRHAVFVPLFGLYYLYVNREDLLKAKIEHCWSALAVAIAGLLIFTYGIWPGQNDFIKDFGMVVSIFGVVLTLTGVQVIKVAWFPIVFLVCALPWPDQVYSILAEPLQKLAASVAVGVLRLTDVEALNTGTKIVMLRKNGQWRTLNVAEACAGLRSLMTFISVAAAVAFLSIRPFWQKTIVVASAIPIAVFCNVVRVSGQGLLDRWCNEQWSEGFAHQFVGLTMLVPGFFLVLLTVWVLDRLFIEEVDPNKHRVRVTPSAQQAAAQQWKLPAATIRSKVVSPPAAKPQPASNPKPAADARVAGMKAPAGVVPVRPAASNPPSAEKPAVPPTQTPIPASSVPKAQGPTGLLSLGQAQVATGTNSRSSLGNGPSPTK